jgi:hypothetical protein
MKPFSSNGAPSAPLAAKHRNLRSLLILAVLVAGASLSAFGQEATVVGTVTDPSGSVIPNVAINITSSDTGITRSVTSNDAGQYVAPDLPIGHYNLKAEASGFKVAEKTGVVLNVGDRTRIDFALTLGATKETITVEANAVRVQSDSGEVSDVITGQQVTQLATNGRSMYTLEALTPGASSLQMDFQVPTSAGGDANVSFNGLREGHNIFLIDGGEDDDRGGGGGSSVMPSMDAIAEFRTLTSNYSAEYGLSSAATITSVIKSGSRQFHAAAWEFDRNDALDARNYFNPAPNKVAELRFNTYGFNVGGPVDVWAKEHKTFFFYNMEWRSLVQGGSYNQTVPLPSTYGGNFGGTLIKVPTAAQLSPAQQARFTADGLTLGGPFPNNTIPTNLLDANAQALLTAGIFPAPTNGAQFQGTPASPTNVREEIARVDHTFNEKFSIYGHFIAEQVSQGYGTTQWSGDNVPTVGNTFGNPSYSYVIHTTYAISPTLLNEASFNYNGNRIHIIPDGLVTAPSAYAFNRVFSGPDVDSRIPSIDLNGSTGTFYTSNWTPWNNTADDYQLRDDLSWTKGAHQIKYGFSWALYKKVQDLFATTQGNFNFNGQYTGNDFADFLLGYAQGYNEAAVKDSGHWNNVSWAAYVQDNWRATHRLTLNLGLRWDGVPHTYEANNRMSNFYPSLYNPSTPPVFNPDGSISSSSPDLITSANPILAGIQFYGNGIGIAGRNGISNGLVENHWAAFGPRIGFAYDLTGQGKTVLRGGFGIMYERIQGNDMYDSGSNIPFSESVNFNNILLDNPKTNVQTGQTINPAITVASITGMSSAQYQLPVSNQYSLGIQQALGPNSVLSVSYVGNQNRHQNFFQEANLPNPGLLPAIQAGTAGPYNQLVPYLGFNDIRLAENEANSHYNSLQVELHARVAKDLTLQTAYTYAKAIDPTTGGGNSFDLDNVSNPYAGWKYDNGPSIFDRTNVAFVNFVYDIPFLKNSDSHLLKATVGGWEVSGIVTMESGAPLNVGLTGSNITSIIPESSNRPNLTGTISYPHTVNEWFNPAAFSDPAPGTWGDLGHDALRGPGRDNWNLALFKSFLISEARGSRLEIRAESFNTWNHTQFEGNVQGGGISTNLGASNFGAVTSAYDPRVFQFGGKLLF